MVVLLIDDQVIVARAIADMLRGEDDLRLVYCQDAAQAPRLAAESTPDVILQDLVMPGRDGFVLLGELRASPSTGGAPVIVLSSNEDPHDKSRAFASGAADYLVKLPDRVELLARLRAHARSHQARRERDEAYRALEQLKRQLEEKNAMLEKLSQSDGLTGLANRRRFDQALEAEWRRGLREGKPVALALVDVDFFKRYNDHYGHQQGDECLRRVAAVLAGVAQRPGDMAARYGGEEFVLLLPGTEPPGAMKVAEEAGARVKALAMPHEKSDAAPHVTISIGVAVLRPGHGATTPADLVARADTALYEAKRTGRARAVAAPEPAAVPAAG